MAANTPLDFRSSINTVLNNIPQGHEKAFKQAIYTTAANLFVLFAVAAAIAVYYILEAFLRPLLWATLCGTFLYPFKRSLTSSLRKWLHGLQESNTPVIVGMALIPINVVNNLYESTFNKFVQYWKLILGGIFGITSLYLLWHFGPVKNIFNGVWSVMSVVYQILGYFNSFWVWTLAVGYLTVVMFCWTPESKRYLRYLSVPVWVVLILHVANVAGYLRVPLFIFLVVVISIGFVAEIKEARKTAEGRTVTPVETVWHILTGETEGEVTKDTEGDVTMETYDEVVEEVAKGEAAKMGDTVETVGGKPQTASPKTEEQETESVKLREHPEREFKKPSHLPVRSPSAPLHKDPSSADRKIKLEVPKGEKSSRSLSENCFIYLFWMLVLTKLWIHIWLVQLLLPVALVMWFFKTSLTHLSSEEGIIGGRVKQLKCVVSDWFLSRRDVLAPRWIRGLFKLITRGDSKIVSLCEKSLDKTTSIVFILLLLVGTALLTVFCAVQIQQESMHLVKMTSEVLNNTLNSEIKSWLPNGEDMQNYMDSMVSNAYLYGRNWIASRLRDMVGGTTGNDTHLETQVLEVWDRLYENWLARKSNNVTSDNIDSPSFQVISYDTMNFKSAWEVITKGDGFNISKIVAFVKDNIGTFMSVLDSVWTVLKGNMNLVFSLVTATLSMVFGGGTALLNFAISSAIFLTTLFYLLASSGDQYKPLQWFASVNPTQSGNTFSQAVEEAITGVFMASLKMAAFYGLYTWLTHTWFGINIIFIPSALAAVFAAVPFVGTYWAALPAVLELWLVQGEGLRSLLLFLCHLLPTSVVDTAIYSDIKGGHPYLTGLAIAGGIYWMGLEGAIIGPILLCCLIVAVRVYGSMLQPDPATPVPGYDREGFMGRIVDRKSMPAVKLMQRSVSSFDMKGNS